MFRWEVGSGSISDVRLRISVNTTQRHLGLAAQLIRALSESSHLRAWWGKNNVDRGIDVYGFVVDSRNPVLPPRDSVYRCLREERWPGDVLEFIGPAILSDNCVENHSSSDTVIGRELQGTDHD